MSRMELKIPPVGVFLLFLLALLGIQALTPAVHTHLAVRVLLVLVLIASSGIFGVTGILHFKRAGTSVHPLEPERSSALVTHGVYTVSRNPMYLALLLALLALGIMQSNLYSIVFALLFVPVMNRLQIIPEERILAERFGEDYFAYCRSVRRWI